jgi:hypothetical protein
MRTDCIVKLSKLQISELNTLVQKETSGDVEGKPLPSDTKSSSYAWHAVACSDVSGAVGQDRWFLQ